jgi:hypothetical protein
MKKAFLTFRTFYAEKWKRVVLHNCHVQFVAEVLSLPHKAALKTDRGNRVLAFWHIYEYTIIFFRYHFCYFCHCHGDSRMPRYSKCQKMNFRHLVGCWRALCCLKFLPPSALWFQLPDIFDIAAPVLNFTVLDPSWICLWISAFCTVALLGTIRFIQPVIGFSSQWHGGNLKTQVLFHWLFTPLWLYNWKQSRY